MMSSNCSNWVTSLARSLVGPIKKNRFRITKPQKCSKSTVEYIWGENINQVSN